MFRYIYTIALIALILFPILEVHILIFTGSILIGLTNGNMKLTKPLLNGLLILSLIIIIGIISAFFRTKTGYNWTKDFIYFLKPMLGIVAGYMLSYHIGNYKYILKAIIYCSLLFAFIHIVKVIYFTQFEFISINEIRKTSGLDNFIEVFALVILVGSYKYKILDLFNSKLLRNWFVLLLSISITLYFSRAMLVGLLILGLSVYGYLRLSKKALKYGLIILFVIGSFYAYLFSIEIDRDKPGISSFLYKMKIAPSEIFSTDYRIDVNNHAELWDHWRAYEAKMAILELNKTPISYLAGNGFGALVDLKFKAPLADEPMRYIPLLHNGYLYVILKTGLIGLCFYLLFITGLYLEMFKKRVLVHQRIFANLIAGLGIYYLFSSLIITGIYNSQEIFIFILGVLFYLSNSNQLKSVK